MVERTQQGVGLSTSGETVDEAAPSQPLDLELGTSVGRYRVLRLIGRGGMGAVYLARDDRLDRNVAIKVLSKRRRGAKDTARLQREAQAMARLNHPNVAKVFEVGTTGGQVFVAMEYIDGLTLREWLKTPRSWQEVLALFTDAGKALARAHEVELVHRDFKPDNVMITREGRVVVLDFGLARGAGDTGSLSGSSSHHGEASSSALLELDLTETGALLGTPAYMSPEGFAGKRIDAKADQFAFCVALYEALYGTRPFEGDNFLALRSNVRSGTMRRVPDRRGVPRRLHRVLLRGLAREPRDRWPSMWRLLDALRDGPREQQRRWQAGAVLVAGAAVAAGVIVQRDPGACERGEERMTEAWGDAERDALRASLGAKRSGAAEEAWTRTSERLDAYAESWTSAYRTACEAKSEALDRQMACLSDRLTDVGALVDALIQGGESMVVRAVPSVVALAGPEDCLDPDRLLQFALPDDPKQARAVVDVRARLAEANALARTGRYAAALDSAILASHDAEATDYPPVVAEAVLKLGAMRMRTGEYDAAELELQRAFSLAAEAGLDDMAARAAIHLVHLNGDVRKDVEAALQWANHARPLVGRASDPDLEGRLENAVAAAYQGQGKYDEAQLHAERALASWSAAFPADHPLLADAHSSLGITAYRRGDLDTALEHHREALRIWAKAFGTTHPEAGAAHVNLGLVAHARDDAAEATMHFRTALSVFEAAYGPTHARVAAVLNNLGLVYRRAQDLEQAEAHFARARDVLRQVHGPDHPYIGAALVNLADIMRQRKKYDAARETYTQALSTYERAYGPENERVATPLIGIGSVAVDSGDVEAGIDAHTRALAILRGSVGEDNVKAAQAMDGLGVAKLAAGERDEAVALFEKAARIYQKIDAVPEHLALARFHLAVTIVDEDRDRALELARAAFNGLSLAHPSRAEVRTWLDEH